MQLSEVLNQVDGFTPPDVTVVIEKVFAYKSGESENGPWSFQDVQVTGGKLKLKGLPEFPASRVGQTVTIRANQSKQYGLTGLKVAHEEYQNKTYDKLIITNSAKWEWGATSENGASPEPPESAAIKNVDAYADHIMACAAIAGRVANDLVVGDAAAIQACFATVVIDTKNRGLLLAKPTTNGHAAEADPKPEPMAEPEPEPDTRHHDPDDDVPF